MLLDRWDNFVPSCTRSLFCRSNSHGDSHQRTSIDQRHTEVWSSLWQKLNPRRHSSSEIHICLRMSFLHLLKPASYSTLLHYICNHPRYRIMQVSVWVPFRCLHIRTSVLTREKCDNYHDRCDRLVYHAECG